ncbi:hypothetical protein Tco_1211807 [Tanacetum coccineum]
MDAIACLSYLSHQHEITMCSFSPIAFEKSPGKRVVEARSTWTVVWVIILGLSVAAVGAYTVAGNNSSEKGWPLLNNFLGKGVWQYAILLESNAMVLRLYVVMAKDERGKSEGINVRRKHVSVLNAVARIHREAMSAPVAVPLLNLDDGYRRRNNQ